MSESDQSLAYESRVPGALLAGEELLWEGESRKKPKRIFRVTDQRIMSIAAQKADESHEMPASEIATLAVNQRGNRSAIRLTPRGGDSVDFVDLIDPRSIETIVLDLWARCGRRARIRRSGGPPPRTMQSTSTVPQAITLHADEVVVWSGRPQPHEFHGKRWQIGRLKIIGWAIVPAATIAASLGYFAPRIKLENPIFPIIAAMWMFFSLRALLVTPFTSASRRRRTTYVLTNIRAIIHLEGRTRLTNSTFLDLIHDVTMVDEADGSGSITFGVTVFECVADVQPVYAKALEAVRNAGKST